MPSVWDSAREQKALQKSIPEQYKYFKRVLMLNMIGIILCPFLYIGGAVLAFLFLDEGLIVAIALLVFFIIIAVWVIKEHIRYSQKVKELKQKLNLRESHD